MSEIDTSTDRIMRLNRLGSADYLHITLADERDALREQVESYRKTANDLALRVTKAETARDAASATLKAWFDRRALAHEAIDEAVLDAVRGYLRISRVGGMDRKTSDMVEGVVADMTRLSVFADLFARAALRNEGDDDA